jgi:histidinol-phosphate aminotransferase
MSAEPFPGLRDAEPYSSPLPDVPVRLNTNECPAPMPEAYLAELDRIARQRPLNRYPDPQITELRAELSRHTHHPADGIWCANGSNEVLMQLLQAYGGPGRRAVLFPPTYLLHGRLCWLTRTEVDAIELAPPFELDDVAVDAAIAAAPHVVFVCSPNNPTGTAQPPERVSAIAEGLPKTLVIVDEAYIEFGGETALPLVAHHPNVAIVRTLSKAFALAGARVGYCLASSEVVEDLMRVRLPYHMSSLTQAAGVAALRRRDDMAPILEAIRAQRERLLRELSALPGVTVYPSHANFVLFVPPRDAGEVWKELVERGVLVRDMTAVVPGALRVTAGAAEEVDAFVSSIREVLPA